MAMSSRLLAWRGVRQAAGAGLRAFSAQRGEAGCRVQSKNKLMQLSKAELVNRVKNLGLQVKRALLRASVHRAIVMLCAQPAGPLGTAGERR